MRTSSRVSSPPDDRDLRLEIGIGGGARRRIGHRLERRRRRRHVRCLRKRDAGGQRQHGDDSRCDTLRQRMGDGYSHLDSSKSRVAIGAFCPRRAGVARDHDCSTDLVFPQLSAARPGTIEHAGQLPPRTPCNNDGVRYAPWRGRAQSCRRQAAHARRGLPASGRHAHARSRRRFVVPLSRVPRAARPAHVARRADGRDARRAVDAAENRRGHQAGLLRRRVRRAGQDIPRRLYPSTRRTAPPMPDDLVRADRAAARAGARATAGRC